MLCPYQGVENITAVLLKVALAVQLAVFGILLGKQRERDDAQSYLVSVAVIQLMVLPVKHGINLLFPDPGGTVSGPTFPDLSIAQLHAHRRG